VKIRKPLLPQKLVEQRTQISCPSCRLDGIELKEPNPRSIQMQLGASRLTTLRIAYAQHEMLEGEERRNRGKEIGIQEETM
jgi:hypothetical protein